MPDNTAANKGQKLESDIKDLPNTGKDLAGSEAGDVKGGMMRADPEATIRVGVGT